MLQLRASDCLFENGRDAVATVARRGPGGIQVSNFFYKAEKALTERVSQVTAHKEVLL